MKILVAGGAGYVGSVLVPVLMERGYEVDVIDLLWFGNHLPAGTRIMERDLFELSEDDLAGYEQIVFLAGLSNDPMAEYSPGDNFIYNAAAPAFLGYLGKRAGVRRYVYASSCSVYGFTSDELYDEDAPTTSGYPYGISKLQGERAAMQLADGDFSVICLRKGTLSGYSPRMRLDICVNTMFRYAVGEGQITIDNPAIWRPILSVQDAAAAYVCAVEADADVTGIFNVASGNYRIGEIGSMVKRVIDEEMGLDIGLEVNHRHDLRNYRVNCDRIEDVLGFRAKHDIPAIVHDLVRNRHAFSDVDNPNYYQIEVFKKLKEGVTV